MDEYSYPMFSEDKKVICQVCGEHFLVISPKHLKKHKVSYSEYKARYPDAPLSCEEFVAMAKYSQERSMFKDILPYIEEKSKEPKIEEEIDITAAYKADKMDIFYVARERVLDELRRFLPDVQKNYPIRNLYPVTNIVIFECMTDFADPVRKVNVEFPNTFWHHRDIADTARKYKLIEMGWKVIELQTDSPTRQEIEKAFSGLDLTLDYI